VLVKVDGSDLILRPSMTTGNKIVTKTISDVTFVPLESVMTGTDSIPYVYLKNGTKQIVVLGESNENNVIVEQGLEPGTTIYLNTPEEPERFTKIAGTELIPVIKQKEKEKKEAERRANMEAQRGSFGGRMGPGMGGDITPEMRQQFQQMRQGGQVDTAMMRRFQQMRNSNQQGGARPAQGTQQQPQQQPRQDQVRPVPQP
jgi:hypothetical protein